MQRDIQANNALTLAIGNGSCASLQLAFQTAAAFLQAHDDMRCALLFSEDRIRGQRFHPPFHVLGDGASALLLERDLATSVIVDTAYSSMGKFCHILGINHWQDQNFNMGEFENKIVPLHYRIVQDLITKVLERQRLRLDQIALLLYQNMSLNDYRGLAGSLGIDMDRVYTGGLKGHGHIFGSDLVINLSLARREGRIGPGDRVLLISSGAGFSWGVTLLEI
jgi:3-oxoacyl-[acyl-carrier-protein] synthase-3